MVDPQLGGIITTGCASSITGTIAKEETQAILPSTKKQIYVLTAIYHNRAFVSTGGPALMLGTMLQIG